MFFSCFVLSVPYYMNKRAIWLSWENQRRNRELSTALNIPLFEFAEIDSIENPLLKYILGLTKTILVVIKTKPKIVFCQNPSIVLSLLILIFKIISDLRVVIDAHNAGLFPLGSQYKILNWLSRIIQRYADLTIVSNDKLKMQVELNRGRAFVLQDKIPELNSNLLKNLKGKYKILFICTYADDEPFEMVFEAAKYIKKDIFIYVTGNFNKKSINPGELPANVILTGFMPDNEYVAMLYSVDATIDLTNRENCLVCGAYESTAAGKPMILSKTRALMEYFNQGVVYVEHNIDDIANGIAEVIERRNELSLQVRDLKKIKAAEWHGKKIELEATLRNLA
jgi:glycosyltransferase involved in cell wall biosynthesis